MNREIRILVAGDDPPGLQHLGENLSREGCSCDIALSRERALDVIRKLECDVVLFDMGGRSVSDLELLELLELTKVLQPQIPVIIGTELPSVTDAVEAIKRGAYQYLAKPFDIDQLVDVAVQAMAESRQFRKTSRPPRPSLGVLRGEVVHQSPLMHELVESIALVSRSNAPVLILGETGTGKERVARAIHAGGSRAHQPFVAVNTSAVPDSLLESEVFGHVRGAFTGATQARRGLLMEADGGTLLLDEIGDMPIMLQPKLLRVLQFGESRPLGSDRCGHVDVRVIAATHRDLNELVRDGRFREDLRYRLNVIPLVVPPLRERREDIIPLISIFLEEARERTVESPVQSISEEALCCMRQAAWPGNVRELENTVERLVVLGRKAEVATTDLQSLQNANQSGSWSVGDGSFETLKQMNRRYLDIVLASTGGDKVRAAGILNIDLSTLYRWSRARR